MFWQIQNIISWTEDNWIRKQLSRLGVKIREKISTQVILTEADLANSFLERVDEQPEEKPSETEATDQTSEDDVAEAEEDSEGKVLSINRVLLRIIGVNFNQRPAIHHSLNPSVRNF